MEQQAPPNMSKCSLPQLSAHVVTILLGHELLQMTLPRSNWTQNHLTCKPELTHMTSCILGLNPPHSVVAVDASRQTMADLLQMIASHRPAHLTTRLHNYPSSCGRHPANTVLSKPVGSGYDHHDWQAQTRRAMD